MCSTSGYNVTSRGIEGSFLTINKLLKQLEIMKKVLVLLVVLSLSFVSCEKDECTVQAQVMVLNQGRTQSTMVEVCHNGDTLTINENALQNHLNHGDTEGACETLSDNSITAEAGEVVDLPCDFDFEEQKISNGKYYLKL